MINRNYKKRILVVGNALSGLCWLYHSFKSWGYSFPEWMHIQVIGKPFKPINYQALIGPGVLEFLSFMEVKNLKLKKLEIGYWDGESFIEPKRGKELYLKKFPKRADKKLRASAVIADTGEYVLSTPLTPIINKFRKQLNLDHGVMFNPATIETKDDLEKWTADRDIIVWATAIQPFLRLAKLRRLHEQVKRALLPIDIISYPNMRADFQEYDYVYDVQLKSRFYRFWPKYQSAEIKHKKKQENEHLIFTGDKNLKELWLRPFAWRGKKVIPFARGAMIAQIVWRDLFDTDRRYWDVT